MNDNQDININLITKKFSDFAKGIDKLDNKNSFNKKIKIDDILDKEILVLSFSKAKSKFNDSKECLSLVIYVNNERRIIFTGSSVLLRQCEDYKDEFPFKTKIIKSGMAYSFS